MELTHFYKGLLKQTRKLFVKDIGKNNYNLKQIDSGGLAKYGYATPNK